MRRQVSADRRAIAPIACNHGLKGIIIFNQIDTFEAGGGILRLSDGTKGTFITGAGAATL